MPISKGCDYDRSPHKIIAV